MKKNRKAANTTFQWIYQNMIKTWILSLHTLMLQRGCSSLPNWNEPKEWEIHVFTTQTKLDMWVLCSVAQGKAVQCIYCLSQPCSYKHLVPPAGQPAHWISLPAIIKAFPNSCPWFTNHNKYERVGTDFSIHFVLKSWLKKKKPSQSFPPFLPPLQHSQFPENKKKKKKQAFSVKQASAVKAMKGT